MKKIKEMVINAKVKMVKAKDRMVKVTLAVASALGVINMPVYADAGELHLDNMNNVVQSLKNIIGYAATIFIAGGAAHFGQSV